MGRLLAHQRFGTCLGISGTSSGKVEREVQTSCYGVIMTSERGYTHIDTRLSCLVKETPFRSQTLHRVMGIPSCHCADAIKPSQHLLLLRLVCHSTSCHEEGGQKAWVPAFSSIIVESNTTDPLRMPQR